MSTSLLACKHCVKATEHSHDGWLSVVYIHMALALRHIYIYICCFIQFQSMWLSTHMAVASLQRCKCLVMIVKTLQLWLRMIETNRLFTSWQGGQRGRDDLPHQGL